MFDTAGMASRRTPVRWRFAFVALLGATLLTGVTPAQATLPGPKGRIAFSDFGADGYSDIFTINPDGTSVVNVTNSPDIDAHPAWSPDGAEIAFASRRDGDFDIWVMNADGSKPVNLSNASPDWDEFPTWSPDGTAIAYSRSGVGIVVADASTGAVLRTIGTASDFYPDWGADGRIAFTSFRDGNAELYVMDADGAHQTRLTNTPSRDEYMPSWAPDISRISFWAIESGSGGTWIMDADGTDTVRLANGGGSSWSPDGTRIVHGWGDLAGVTTMDPDGTDQVAVHGAFGSQIPDRPAWGTADFLKEPPGPPTVEVSLGNERGVRVLWYDDTEEGTTRWFGVSAYEGSFFGSTYRVASFQSLEGRWDGTAWTWISVIGGLTFDPDLTFTRGGGAATLSGVFDLYRCDEPDYCSGYTPLGTTSVVTASWKATPGRIEWPPGLHYSWDDPACAVSQVSGVLRYRPATATAVWDEHAFPEPTTDFENAEFEFARNHTITVCDA